MPQLAAAKVNAILIVPQGPKDAQDSGGGKLENDPGAFAKLMGEVTDYLNAEGKIHTKKIGKIVLTTHSGGQQATGRHYTLGGMNDHITDVPLLDPSHGSPRNGSPDWCKADKSHRLASLFTDHLAKTNDEFMGDLDKADVKYIKLDEPTLTDEQFRPRGPSSCTPRPHDFNFSRTLKSSKSVVSPALLRCR